MFPKLNIPSFEAKIKRQENNPDSYQIFDVVRKKWILLTSEEWVRQHVVHFLLSQNYSKNLMQVESQHAYQERRKRTDILVFDRMGNPFLVVECKASHIALSSKVFEQVAIYNHCIEAPFVMITNGMQLAIFEKKLNNKEKFEYQSTEFLPRKS